MTEKIPHVNRTVMFAAAAKSVQPEFICKCRGCRENKEHKANSFGPGPGCPTHQ